MKPIKFLIGSLVLAAVATMAVVLIGPASAAGNFGHSLGLAGSFQQPPQEIEGCPEGYVCLTVEEYAALIKGKKSCEQLYTPTSTSTQPPEVTPTPEVTVTPTPEVTVTPTPTPEVRTPPDNCGRDHDHDCGHGNDGDQLDNDNPHGGPSKGTPGDGQDVEHGGNKGGRFNK